MRSSLSRSVCTASLQLSYSGDISLRQRRHTCPAVPRHKTTPFLKQRLTHSSFSSILHALPHCWRTQHTITRERNTAVSPAKKAAVTCPEAECDTFTLSLPLFLPHTHTELLRIVTPDPVIQTSASSPMYTALGQLDFFFLPQTPRRRGRMKHSHSGLSESRHQECLLPYHFKGTQRQSKKIELSNTRVNRKTRIRPD